MRLITARTLATLVMLVAPAMMLWAQEVNGKFAWTTQIFLDELKEQAEQPAQGPRRAPRHPQYDGTKTSKQLQLIANPDTVDGVAYISCFIHLKDVKELDEVRALGVEVEETFDGLNFITARVPVRKIEALAGVENVTKIRVAQLMRTMTDQARELTHVDDLLTQSADALDVGVNHLYDGTDVVLGIIDTGIDFQHIAFKDKDGNSRIKRAYVYNGSTEKLYTGVTSLAPTTDDATQDHGTHTASTAGGSSVIIDNGSTVTVTDNHAAATYGGMAPGADLYLAGVKNLKDNCLANALKKMVEYADSVEKPLVVSNSWGSGWGPHDGTGYWADLVASYFGDSHPNHIILFSAANDAGYKTGDEGGGYFVKKSAASSTNPLGTIIRTDGNGGNYYQGLIACAWLASKPKCNLYVLDNSGAILKSWTIDKQIDTSDSSFVDFSTYYYTGGKLVFYYDVENGKHRLAVYSGKGIETASEDAYTLAIEVYPAEDSADINMWGGSQSYFTNHLTTAGHTWTDGTDDMCVGNEATIPDAISVGAYMSKYNWNDYDGAPHSYVRANGLGDIAAFSSYATAEQSPTGLAYPWITAPGAMVMAGVNHYHTTEVDENSYYADKKKLFFVVNNPDYPYGAMQGTSMATPVAAGIVAQWLQAANSLGKSLTVNEVKAIMEQTAIQDEFTTTGSNASHFGKGKIDALAGIRYILQNYGGQLALANNSNNEKAISTAAESEKTYDVTLHGRTLYKDGDWNTLCLPFSIANINAEGCPLAGAIVRALDNASFSDGTLTLNFKEPTTEIEAGQPYIVKWAKPDGYDGHASDFDIVNPVFSGVTVSTVINDFTSTDSHVAFRGTYSATNLDEKNQNILFMGTGSTLYWPDGKDVTTIGAQRAYFELDLNALGIGSGAKVRNIVLNFDGEASGIDALTADAETADAAWYTLSGVKLQGRPTAKGLYLHGNKKILVP